MENEHTIPKKKEKKNNIQKQHQHHTLFPNNNHINISLFFPFAKVLALSWMNHKLWFTIHTSWFVAIKMHCNRSKLLEEWRAFIQSRPSTHPYNVPPSVCMLTHIDDIFEFAATTRDLSNSLFDNFMQFFFVVMCHLYYLHVIAFLSGFMWLLCVCEQAWLWHCSKD